MKICAIQLTSGPDFAANLDEVQRRILDAVQEGVTLIILPENVFLFNGKAMRELSEQESIQESLFTTLNKLSVTLGVWIVVGSHPSLKRPDGSVVAGSRVRQSCLVFSPFSSECFRYDKIHLFDVNVADGVGQYKESDFIEPGELNPIVIDVDGLKVGLSICYDLRFPELYRELVSKGAELIVVPAAFTYVTGKAHWNTLLRARAIENQVFIVGVNQCGFHGKNRQTYGHSVCYSPWGEDLGQLADEPDNLYVNIDTDRIQECKSSMPVLEHRRLT
ncbi:carbon-nitrogen hydrolase family protein [Marinomonas algicola]|uniref:carbon-nitrogen hydrolase family protein n=1 Tax=Marinomonas algicola TaxID=2773454 RepID=UPI00174B0175|nr:carbon-nitrogen hydrolase family protein [Marinomonas algicola]